MSEVPADRFDAFLLDLDGVLFRGTEPVVGAAETVTRLRNAGKAIAFVTNNSARTPAQVVAHLAAVGVEAEPSEVETSPSPRPVSWPDVASAGHSSWGSGASAKR